MLYTKEYNKRHVARLKKNGTETFIKSASARRSL